MLGRVPKLRVAAVSVIVILLFFFAPIVPYFQAATVPRAYMAGLGPCLSGVSQTNLTLAESQRNACFSDFSYPPAGLLGFATPAYGVLGYGAPPYGPIELASAGNHSALVFFKGGQAVAVEDAGVQGVALNPSGVVDIQVAAVTSFDFGILNISVQLRNIGYYAIEDPSVYISMQGFSSNGTIGGLTLIEPKPLGACAASWEPAEYCGVSQLAPNELPVNKSFTFYAEVRGSVNGQPFLYRQGYGEDFPRGGVGPLWMKAFMAQVNRERAGPALMENSTLDAFAALRFSNASAVYQVSDYGLTEDASKFFGQSIPTDQVAEELLFPGAYSPTYYPSFLSMYAAGHWDALDNPVYRQFGYYVGRAPYYLVSVPCSVYEIPSAGINITQFFSNHGCSTMIAPSTWLVLIMTP